MIKLYRKLSDLSACFFFVVKGFSLNIDRERRYIGEIRVAHAIIALQAAHACALRALACAGKTLKNQNCKGFPTHQPTTRGDTTQNKGPLYHFSFF